MGQKVHGRTGTDNDIVLGLEACATEPPSVLRHADFGLLMNQASVDRNVRYAFDRLASVVSGRLIALFSPQHGLWGEEQANMVLSPHGRHPRRADVPLYSLYGDTRRPTSEMLDGLDALVIDLQDVGTRVYTYIWTVTYCLEACAEKGIPVVLLDRPNPLGGEIVEGPLLEPATASFVGRAPIPMRHALTIGELASFLNISMEIQAELTIVRMRNWQRETHWPTTRLCWVPPSPNLPTFASALVYPGQVLLEGTNLSEGRGTTIPFELVGAPFVDGFQLADRLERLRLPGVAFRAVRFRPTFDKWAGASCGGIALHVTNPHALRPFRTTVSVLASVKSLWPDSFRWLPPPYEFEHELMPIDIIAGTSRLRHWLDGNPDPMQDLPTDVVGSATVEWLESVELHLLY